MPTKLQKGFSQNEHTIGYTPFSSVHESVLYRLNSIARSFACFPFLPSFFGYRYLEKYSET